MENQLNKRYGLFTAICMVVGIVVGSGVFFKAEKILLCTGGRTSLGIWAWLIGGVIMVSCAYVFGTMASKYEKCNGIVDYAEQALGPKYGYIVGWFMAVIYYPTLVSVLAWVTARYFCVLIGWDITGGQCMVIAGFLLILAFVSNTLSPVIAGKVQVATTVIKFIPLILMAVVGTVSGLRSGLTAENFAYRVEDAMPAGPALFTAVCATAFAYEGWIVATSINSEIKDSKKNLPRALFMGTLIIVFIYIVYYIGLSGAVDNATMMAGGETGAKLAYQALFSRFAGTGVFVLIVISCYGVLNGLMVGNVRGFYSLAVRGEGYNPKMMSQVDPVTNMPTNAAVFSLLVAGWWLLYFYGANLTEPWFGPFCFDTSELPIITIYAMYIPIFISLMAKEKELPTFKRFFMPAVALCGSVFMMIAACFSHGTAVIYYLIIFAVIMCIGLPRMKKKS
ncbi:MAG: APC family permease [Clostridiales bacterium]|nr:APC family permease [Clostridiales bacterium]MDD7035478.1 APC family permease [Bacillota bacterium]MDY2919939.1 APC family permease [Lentihominibacter sp.]